MNPSEMREEQDAYEQATLAQKIAAVEAWVKKRDIVSKETVASLATRFHLSAKEVRVVIDRARYKLAAHAEAYVEAHMLSVELGLEIARDGGKQAAAGLQVAQKGAEWALERIGQGHSRVLDAPKAQGATGPQIVIGIQVGGIQAKNTVEEPAIEGQIEAESTVIVTPESEDRGESPINTPIEPVRLDLKTATPIVPAPQSIIKKRVRKLTRSQQDVEKKVQAILAAVTPDNAQMMMRSIMDLGYDAAFSWEMVKAMLDLEEGKS